MNQIQDLLSAMGLKSKKGLSSSLFQTAPDGSGVNPTFFEVLSRFLTDVAFYEIDNKGRVVRWDESAVRLQSYTRDEVMGKSFSIFYPSGSVCERSLTIAALEGQHRETSWRLRKGGNPFWAESFTYALRDEAGHLKGFTQVVRDLTRQKRLENELRIAKAAAETERQAKISFLANLSHEIRTPLGAVLGFAELMQNPNQSYSDRADLLSMIKRNGEQLAHVINDLLDLSKIESGRHEITSFQFDLSDLISDLIAVHRQEAVDKGVRFHLEVEDFVPEKITADPIRLRQILENVLDNAVKYTDRGEILFKVKLVQSGAYRNEQAAHQLVFTIKDSGRGISEEQRLHLFEPFLQSEDGSARKIGGTGLGLVLSRQLSRSLGGDLFLSETLPDKGSTFTITIPTGSIDGVPLTNSLERRMGVGNHSGRDVQGQPGAQLSSQSQGVNQSVKNSQSQCLRGIKILVVEDALDNQFIAGRFLRLEGAEVTFAGDGIEGVEKALATPVDLILMDIHMPKRDGFEATRELRKNGFNKPIIALTARAVQEELDRCLEAGCDDCITKPIDRSALVGKVAKYAFQVAI